ncbi:MAG: hypothetical protein ABTD50_15175 [Polyangiaceae bacterium]|jgi:hypothetical protein
MTGRLKRAERLLDFADRSVKSALAAAAAAERTVLAARAECETSERAWESAAQAFGAGVAFAVDLRDQSAHLRSLRVRADASAAKLSAALESERKARAMVIETSRKRRTLELWRDRIVETDQAEQRALERRGSDELAARVVRVRP